MTPLAPPASFAPAPAAAPAAPLGHPRTHSSGADLLRGVAILLVIVYHAVGAFHGFYLPWHGYARDFAAMPLGRLLWFYPLSFGWTGVALFFVLSGFCIHFSFLRGPRFDARRFFWRRFWRIYPAYLVALAVFFVLDGESVFTRDGAAQLGSHLVFLHNAGHRLFYGVNGAFWSIAVEMQLYALYPLLLWGRERFGLGRCLLGTFALGCAWRVVAVAVWGLPEGPIAPALTLPPLTWFDWTLGAFVAERFHAGQRAWTRHGVWLAVLGALFVGSTLYKPLMVFSFSLAAGASAVLLDAALHVPWGRRGWVVALEFVGLVSYSLYLWHQPLIVPAVGFLSRVLGSPVAAWTVFAAALLAGSWASFHLLEQPGIRVGNFLWNGQRLRHKSPNQHE